MRVTLNRPHRRNAFDAGMVAELCETFRRLGAESSVRAIVLTGAGSVFCAGADLRWMGTERTVSPPEARQDAEDLSAMYRAIEACPCPVIGRIQGAAFGGGVGLISVCDIAVAAADATFGLSEVRLGLIPAVIGPFLLRKCGLSFVHRYSLTGEPFSAATAKAAGLVHDLLEATALDARVDELSDMVLRLAPHAARETKALFRRLPSLPDDQQWKLCIDKNVQARLSAEAREGLRAFHERRPPVWDEQGDATQLAQGTLRDAEPQRT
ncbi:MAG: enoyl-CoA hydratase-related protein [Nitrospiraceae bacterium]